MLRHAFKTLSAFTLTLLLSSGFAAPQATAKKTAAKTAEKLQWVSWSDDVFKQAKAEHRFVLLDLEAVWCHWCHVMDETTYRDPTVAKLLGERFIAIKVDQDANPDLSVRYERYGWPGTIVLDGEGVEIVKRRGYFPPQR